MPFAVDQQRGRHNLHFVDEAIAEHGAKCLEIVVAPRRQRAGQVLVADKNGSVLREGRVAEHMIRMDMGIDDVAYRLRRHGADRRKKPFTFARAAAGIDHRDRFIADDEADIGGVALIRLVHHLDGTDVNIDAGRDFGHRQRRDRLLFPGEANVASQQADGNQPQDGARETRRPRCAPIATGSKDRMGGAPLMNRRSMDHPNFSSFVGFRPGSVVTFLGRFPLTLQCKRPSRPPSASTKS